MLTRLTISNFKRLGDAEIELGSPVVFIGPNNSGKTSAMQALALWDVGVKRWKERRSGRSPGQRPGVTVNRRDLVAIPVPNARLLWRDLHVRDLQRENGTQRTQNVLIGVTVDGVTNGEVWTCGMEFDYANEESFYCRPRRTDGGRMPVPEAAGAETVAFLPPMSGLAATETRLDAGAVDVRVGEGRTAEVLRNLCYSIHQERPESWEKLAGQMEQLFRVRLDAPRYIAERGEIAMHYHERGVSLDLSSSGRGLQQTLLLLAYLRAKPGAVLLLDEPDAHLEILRQREIYRLIAESAAESGSQVIAASHSEVLLTEAAGKDMVIAFVGRPHRLDGRGEQVRKALREIGFDNYYQAEQTGWVLYLEGSTDLALLRTLAERLGHRAAAQALERPFVQYVENQPQKALAHYYGLKEAVPSLNGLAIFDRLERELPPGGDLQSLAWQRRELENYVCSPATLEAYAGQFGIEHQEGPLFARGVSERRVNAMREAIAEIGNALMALRGYSPWSSEVKASDEFLTPLFRSYFQRLELPNLMNKKDFYELANYVPLEEIDGEITEKLDAIAGVAAQSAPPRDGE